MNKRNIGLAVLAIIALLLVSIIARYFLNTKGIGPAQFGCVKESKEIVHKGSNMNGILEDGKTYEVLMNYYECNPLQRGDVVLYRFSSQMDPVMRVVRGVEGDRFEAVQDKTRPAWNLEINGQLIMAAGDLPYFFGSSAAKPTLSLYEASRKNILGKGEAILLSTIPPGMSDSGMFGLVAQQDVIGKVKVEKAK